MKPEKIPDGIRLEAGMILARKERAVPDKGKPERHKVVILVKPTLMSHLTNPFSPASEQVRRDESGWYLVRLFSGSDDPNVPAVIGPGTFSKAREAVIRKMYHFVGYIGQVDQPIDWDAM